MLEEYQNPFYTAYFEANFILTEFTRIKIYQNFYLHLPEFTRVIESLKYL